MAKQKHKTLSDVMFSPKKSEKFFKSIEASSKEIFKSNKKLFDALSKF